MFFHSFIIRLFLFVLISGHRKFLKKIVSHIILVSTQWYVFLSTDTYRNGWIVWWRRALSRSIQGTDSSCPMTSRRCGPTGTGPQSSQYSATWSPNWSRFSPKRDPGVSKGSDSVKFIKNLTRVPYIILMHPPPFLKKRSMLFAHVVGRSFSRSVEQAMSAYYLFGPFAWKLPNLVQ